jgi:hypothetical protein
MDIFCLIISLNGLAPEDCGLATSMADFYNYKHAIQ